MRRIVSLGASVIPIMSEAVSGTDTRFYTAEGLRGEVAGITGREPIRTITGAEPIGPRGLADILAVAPCTSNTLGKLACGINDTPVTMAVKSVLRNDIPVVIAVSTNDGLGASAANIGVMLNRRNIYFVPFGQDDPMGKQRALAARLELLIPALEAAAAGRQLQPLLCAL